MTTFGTARWQGGLKDGKGFLSTKSGVLSEQAYGFASRFEGKPGTNPEELIGAAHAGCFTMALSKILGDAGFMTNDSLDEEGNASLAMSLLGRTGRVWWLPSTLGGGPTNVTPASATARAKPEFSLKKPYPG